MKSLQARRAIKAAMMTGLAAGALAWAGCSFLPEPKTDPTRHYVLTGPGLVSGGNPQAGGASEATTEVAGRGSADAKADGAVVGLRSVQVAPYLNGKAMIVRSAANEIVYEDFARWAEPLDLSVGRMLAAQLAGSRGVKRVYAQPFPFDAERDYDVRIEVLRCEGARKADGTMVASFACLIEIAESGKVGGASGEVVVRKVFTAPETPWTARDFGALAQGLSAAVAAAGAEVAALIPEADSEGEGAK